MGTGMDAKALSDQLTTQYRAYRDILSATHDEKEAARRVLSALTGSLDSVLRERIADAPTGTIDDIFPRLITALISAATLTQRQGNGQNKHHKGTP